MGRLRVDIAYKADFETQDTVGEATTQDLSFQSRAWSPSYMRALGQGISVAFAPHPYKTGKSIVAAQFRSSCRRAVETHAFFIADFSESSKKGVAFT